MVQGEYLKVIAKIIKNDPFLKRNHHYLHNIINVTSTTIIISITQFIYNFEIRHINKSQDHGRVGGRSVKDQESGLRHGMLIFD